MIALRWRWMYWNQDTLLYVTLSSGGLHDPLSYIYKELEVRGNDHDHETQDDM